MDKSVTKIVTVMIHSLLEGNPYEGHLAIKTKCPFLFPLINPVMSLLGTGELTTPQRFRDKNEDDILWARRCFRKAREMVSAPVIRWG